MRTYFVISQIIYVLCFIPWLLIWGISFMGFDSGISGAAIALVSVIGVYPLVTIACAIMAWVFYKKRKRAAVIVNSIPLLWVLGIGVPVLALNLS
ncbi:hypothetical protein P4H83_02650 [Paenibacillus favisporus]|uniref:hypothetical protein n=1 Tax=Paenibacillus TaxID=44249 RepID=UPI0011AB8565|nr:MULTISPECIES: hypothetical protein [Paenibacillus]MEC0173765.1 hypothetical protein [Paenibacillus favisporus]